MRKLSCIRGYFQYGWRNHDSRTCRHGNPESRLSNDTQWLNSVVEGIEDLVKRYAQGRCQNHFSGQPQHENYSGAKVEEEKQTKIVAFELSQKMPFPLSELIWDYQVIDDGVEQEIIAFAVKPSRDPFAKGLWWS